MNGVLLWLGVGLVGGAGATARLVLDRAISARARGFPCGTLAVNLSGSLLLGLVVGAGLRGDALLIVGTGLLGSYTTFSTWMLETHRLGHAGERRAAVVNVLVSLGAGLGAVALGRLLGGTL